MRRFRTSVRLLPSGSQRQPGGAPGWGWLMLALLAASPSFADTAHLPEARKQLIGATALVTEQTSGIDFRARVDTGASSCSMHVEELILEGGPAEDPDDDVGKEIRFRIINSLGESHWIRSKVSRVVAIRTSDSRREIRYKVFLTLRRNGFEKRVLVNLNDRSHLEYPMLLGRNYLRKDFLVDVDLDKDTRHPEEDEEEAEAKEATARTAAKRTTK